MTTNRLKTQVFSAVAGALLVALSGARAGAQQESRVTAIRDEATRAVVIEQLGLAKEHGVPTEPLLSRAFEGVARNASSAKIREVMNALEKRLRRAGELLAPAASPDELSAGADALSVGVPEKILKQMRQAAPKRSIAVELGVLTELVARKVAPAKASKMVLELMARGATGAQLTAMSNAVQSDVAAGLTPEAALDRHGRGILSLLPPPSGVSNGQPRPR
jgi:type II secretory pathway component PulF